MEIRARASGARWLPTTESGEDAESVSYAAGDCIVSANVWSTHVAPATRMTVFDRPPNAPIWAVLLFTVSMTSCLCAHPPDLHPAGFVADQDTLHLRDSTAASLAMTDLLDKEVASEEPPAGDDILLADGTFQPADSSAPSSVFGSVLGYLPSKMPNVSSTWAYINGALAVAVPLAVLYIASRTGARVVRYRPSGRMRVYTRLDNQLGKGKLIDFGIAEGILENGATKGTLSLSSPIRLCLGANACLRLPALTQTTSKLSGCICRLSASTRLTSRPASSFLLSPSTSGRLMRRS